MLEKLDRNPAPAAIQGSQTRHGPATSSAATSARRRGLGGRRFLLSLAIIGASISLALGVSLPSIKLTKFYFFSTEYSLITTVLTLIQRNQIFLGSLVFIFSILL